jgi:hypothetical protein
MTLAFASMSPSGSSASAYEVIMSNTLECMIRFKSTLAVSLGVFPVNYCAPLILTRICTKGITLHDYSSSSFVNFMEGIG